MSVILSEVHVGFHDSDIKSCQTVFSAEEEFDITLELDVDEELILLCRCQMIIGVSGFVSGVIRSKFGFIKVLIRAKKTHVN